MRCRRVSRVGELERDGYHVYNYVLCDKAQGRVLLRVIMRTFGVGELVEHRWSESDVVSFWELVRGDRGGGEEHYGTLRVLCLGG